MGWQPEHSYCVGDVARTCSQGRLFLHLSSCHYVQVCTLSTSGVQENGSTWSQSIASPWKLPCPSSQGIAILCSVKCGVFDLLTLKFVAFIIMVGRENTGCVCCTAEEVGSTRKNTWHWPHLHSGMLTHVFLWALSSSFCAVSAMLECRVVTFQATWVVYVRRAAFSHRYPNQTFRPCHAY